MVGFRFSWTERSLAQSVSQAPLPSRAASAPRQVRKSLIDQDGEAFRFVSSKAEQK
jgi:hypothetical protein